MYVCISVCTYIYIYMYITYREVLSPKLLLGIGASKTILKSLDLESKTTEIVLKSSRDHQGYFLCLNYSNIIVDVDMSLIIITKIVNNIIINQPVKDAARGTAAAGILCGRRIVGVEVRIWYDTVQYNMI